MTDPNRHGGDDRHGEADRGGDVRGPPDEREATAGPGPGRDPRDEPDRVANEERRRNTPFVTGLVVVLGAWVGLSAFVYDPSPAAYWNSVIVGVAVVLGAGYNYYRQYNDVPLSAGVAALVTVLGIWLVVSSVVLELGAGAFWSTLVSGLLIAGLTGYNAYEAREARAVATEPGREAP